jgi:integrase/recombinase XerD
VTALAPTLQAFFTDRLIRQRRASPETVAAYRDALRLLLVFAVARIGTHPRHGEHQEQPQRVAARHRRS